MHVRRSFNAALLLAASVVACESDLGGPRSIREIRGAVRSPFGADGAVVLGLRGRGIASIEADSAAVFVERDGSQLRVILVRETPGTIRFRLDVIDRHAVISADVIDAVDGGNQPRPSLDGYSVEWGR